MIYLVDTNVLLRFADRSDPQHSATRRAVARLLHEQHSFCVTSQNLIEFWNVLTRPVERNGFGKSPSEAETLLELTEQLFPRIADPPGLYEQWRKIVVRFGVSGVQVHDARLVAWMIAHEIFQILTFNEADFRRYAELGVRASNPNDLIEKLKSPEL